MGLSMSREQIIWAVADRGLDAPCAWCSYNGQGYWQSGTHAESCPWHKIGGHEERKEHIAKKASEEAG